MPPRRPPPIRSLAEAASAIALLWETAFARQQVQVGGDLTGRPETPTLNPNAQALKHTLLGPRHIDTVQATPSNGSLVVGVGSTWRELSAGSSGQVLTVGGNGLLAWANGGGGGGGAPTNAKYLTLGTDATLTDERVLVPSARFSTNDGGAGGNYALDLANAGTAGTYAYPVSVTTDAYGRVTGVTAGQAPATPPSPASSVVTETSYGQSSATGTSSNYAREDHTHGTPAVPAHTALSSLAWTSAGHTGSSTAVAAWNGNANAVVVQATTDETMLVRRAGVLQWVPLIVGIAVYADFTGDAGVYLDAAKPELYIGTVI
jgi:hypothetical protein